MPTLTNKMIWEPVAFPLVKGVDLNTRKRLIDIGSLEVAENVYYPRAGGPEKRRGHDAHTLYNANVTYTANPPADNLYGYGLFDPLNLPTGTCVYPHIGDIKDILVFDNAEIAWDGWRFYEPLAAGSGKCKVTTATLPTYTSNSIAKIAETQDQACSADNGVIKVVAYTYPSNAVAKIYDSVTGVLKFTYALNNGSNDPVYVRTVACGEFVHVLVSDATDGLVYNYAFHNTGTTVRRITDAVIIDADIFDVWKFDETRFLVGGPMGGDVNLTWLNFNGTINEDDLAQNTTVDTDTLAANIALCVHPVSRQIGIAFDIGTAVIMRVFDANGTELNSVSALVTNDATHLAIAPTYIDNYFYVFIEVDDLTGSPSIVVKKCLNGAVTSTTTRYNVHLASKACRVGNLPFVWATNSGTVLQTTFFLMDSEVLPVAKTEYGTAYERTTDPGWLPSINFMVADEGTWNTAKFNGALVYRARVDTSEDAETIPGTGQTFSDPGIKAYNLNFLPDSLSYTVAGKTLYIAGGQLWNYDGDQLLDAQPPIGMELPDTSAVFTKANGAGSLTNSGLYYYRVDGCRRNAKGEEIRTVSYLSEQVDLGVADDTVTVHIRNQPTRCTDMYYLVFRTQTTGTVLYLVSPRNPTSAPQYSTVSPTTSYVDEAADTTLLDNERHPANADNYLQPIAAPACEIVTYGQNRLWISGGELSPGEVWSSRLFYAGQTPAFHWALGVQIDTDFSPITALAFLSDYGVVFKRGSTYLLTGNISPNIYQPVAPNVQLALADRGCINRRSVCRLYNSITFQSESGYKVIGAGGQMEDIGFPVENAAGNCIGAVLVRDDEHVRFYQSDAATLVFDYRDKLWSTFNFNNKPTTAVLSNRTGKAVIAVGKRLMYESETSMTDGGFDYYYTIRTAPIAKQIGGLQRVRRVYCIGESEGIPPGVTIRFYINGHDWWSEVVRWDYDDDLNTSTLGTSTLGNNFVGDSSSEFRDDIWKFRKRLAIASQKCESIQVELTDNGRIRPSSKWIPVAFGLEIGTKEGLDRLAGRTFTSE